MKITGNPFNYNNLTQNNNKINKMFRPWNNKTIMTGQGLFGFNVGKKKEDKVEYGGNIGSISKKMTDDLIADKIARKVARGDYITAEERAILMELAPEKLEKAEKAGRRRKEIEARLKGSKTKKEARDIILQAKMEAATAFEKYDQAYGEYLMIAVDKLEADYNKKSMTEEDEISKLEVEKQKSKGIDVRL